MKKLISFFSSKKKSTNTSRKKQNAENVSMKYVMIRISKRYHLQEKNEEMKYID